MAVAVAGLSVLGSSCGKDTDSPGRQSGAGGAEGGTDEAAPAVATNRGPDPVVELSGAQLGNSDTGRASVNIDGANGQLCVFLTVQGETSPSLVHIHEKPPDRARPALVEVRISPAGTGCVIGSGNVARVEAERGRFYVDVHAGPGGQERLRGSFGGEP